MKLQAVVVAAFSRAAKFQLVSAFVVFPLNRSFHQAALTVHSLHDWEILFADTA